MKKIKRIREKTGYFVFALVFNVMLLTQVSIVSACDGDGVACQIAQKHLQSMVKSGMCLEGWDEGTSVKDCFELYDVDNKVVARCVEMKDENGKDNGYVVVGANSEVPPIIEFSTSGKFCIDEEENGYYFGGYDYYTLSDENDEFVSVNGDEFVSENAVINNKKNKKCDYSSEWNAFCSDKLYVEEKSDIDEYEIGNSKFLGNSTPPVNGVHIENPYLYENGWISVAPIDVKKYNNFYFTTNNFGGCTAHCAPTAATNLIRYWFMRDNSKYASLIGSLEWWQVFGILHTHMETDSSGTNVQNICKGLKKYLNYMNLDSSGVRYLDHPDFYDVVYEIDNGKGGRPFLYCVFEHKRYGNHCMLALGYMEFEYGDGDYYSRYIRVADGWDNYPNRYVHFKIGQDASERCIITFKPKL